MSLCIFIFSCKSDEKEQLIGIDENELIAKMVDLYYLDAWIGRTSPSGRDSIQKRLQVEFEIAHGQSPSEVDSILGILQKDQDTYSRLMDSVIHILKTQKD